MSNRLGGRQGTAYVGTNAIQPPDYTFTDRDPTQYDINNVSLGDFWLNQSNQNLWVLVSLERTMAGPGSVATWVKLESGGIVTGPLDTLTGTTGGPIPPDINANINLVSGIFGLSFDGDPATNTITLNSTTPDNIVETLTGNTGGPVPALLGNINVVGDNIGITSVGNPATNTITLSLVGGGDAAETFPTDSGTADSIGGVLNIIANTAALNAGSSVSFSGSSNTVQLNVTDGLVNTIIGSGAGNATLLGTDNTALGEGAAHGLTTGSANVIIGESAGNVLTTGSDNTIVGEGSGALLTTGSNNTLIGRFSGHNYTTTESSNICIGDATLGTISESNVLRIGAATGSSAGQLNKSFIAGIVGITPDTADGIPVFIGSDGQLGTVGSSGSTFVATVTGDNAVAVSPSSGNIFIKGDGSTATVTGNAGTHTLTITALGGGGGTLNDLIGDDGTPVAPLAGIINVIAGQSTQNSGSSVQFTGTVANTLTLNVTDISDNTIIGFGAGNATLSGLNNTVLGEGTAVAFTTASSNTIVGKSAGVGITSGSLNILLGTDSGSAYTSTESSNILIGSTGTIAQSNSLRIGAGTGAGSGQLNKSFIHGILGITPATADGIPVFIGSAGQLGTVGTGGTTLIQTVTGNSGGAVGPSAGNINIRGDGVTANVVGNPGTNTLTISAIGGGGGGASDFVTDNGTAIEAGGVINIVADNITQDCGSSVLFSAVGNTVALNVTDSNSNTIIGFHSGKASITGTKNTALGLSCGSALTSGSSNIFIGNQVGSFVTTGTGNFLCGDGSLNTVLKGTTTSSGLYAFGTTTNLFLHNWGGTSSSNTFIGYGSGGAFNAGQQVANRQNTAVGVGSVFSLTSGTNNTSIGYTAGTNITTGSNNTLIGTVAGGAYTTSESSNIVINATGITGQSNTLTIGQGTGSGVLQLNRAFISGIRGITTANANAIPVVIDSAGQLGTAGGVSFVNTLTGNTGGPVSASAGNINVVGDGTTITVTDNPGLNKLTISAIGGGGGGNAGNPSFMAYLTNDIPYLATIVTKIVYDTLAYNLGTAFNLGTSTFTAPATGLYNFSIGFGTSGGSSTTPSGYAQVVTSNRSYAIMSSNFVNLFWNIGATGRRFAFGNDIYANMIIGDTAIVQFFVTQASGTPVITGSSSSTANAGVINFFGGARIS